MSPPYPSAEYQCTPLIGVPVSQDSEQYPLTQALWAIQAGGIGDWLHDNRIRMYGWVNASTNWTNNQNSNGPDSYWLRANKLELDQFVVKLEREVDTIQQDHWDVGFRSVALYGQDYRFTTAGGWGINQCGHPKSRLFKQSPRPQFGD